MNVGRLSTIDALFTSLDITTVEPGDMIYYVCSATNNRGRDQAVVSLYSKFVSFVLTLFIWKYAMTLYKIFSYNPDLWKYKTDTTCGVPKIIAILWSAFKTFISTYQTCLLVFHLTISLQFLRHIDCMLQGSTHLLGSPVRPITPPLHLC